jgi:hypothetical protein
MFNTKNWFDMKRPYMFIAVALIITTLLILYDHLGGFKDPVLSFEPVREYSFAGNFFQGKTSDPLLEELFDEMRSLKNREHYNGPLVMVWYEIPESSKDSIQLFVGLELMPDEHFPDHLDSLYLEMGGLVRATIRKHASVMPSPSLIIDKIKEHADSQQYKLQNLVIDKYLSDTLVYTEIPLEF